MFASVADGEISFVGLTPGILVCLAVVRWVNELFAGKRGSSEGKKQGSMVRTLRSVKSHLKAALHSILPQEHRSHPQ